VLLCSSTPPVCDGDHRSDVYALVDLDARYADVVPDGVAWFHALRGSAA